MLIKSVKENLGKVASLDNGDWVIAYSGGVDSRLLLDVLYKIKPDNKKIKVVHVNHGLSKNAEAWEKAAEGIVSRYPGVELVTARLNMTETSAIEEKAREYRYQVFQDNMSEGDLIFMGHHKNDNMETVLFRLFRGTALKGLSGIPFTRAFGKGNIVRPLMDTTRKEIEKYAVENELSWVEDESNSDSKYSRNFLRNEVIPLIEKRWANAIHVINQLSVKAQENEELIAEVAQEDLVKVKDLYKGKEALNLEKILLLSKVRQKNLICYYLKEKGFSINSGKMFEELLKSIFMENKNNSSLRKKDLGPFVVVTNGKKVWIDDKS